MCSGHSRRGYGAPGLRAALKPPAAPCDSPYHFIPGVFKPRENLLVRHPAAASRRTERPQVLTVLWLRKLILRFCTSTDGEVADAFYPYCAPQRRLRFRARGVMRALEICGAWRSACDLLQVALMSITTRALKTQDWKTFRQIRLRALREHPDMYLGSYQDTAARTEREWMEMLDSQGQCIFGLFDGDGIIGLAAVFTAREDPSGQSGVLAMDYIDPLYRGRHLSRILYNARIDWAKQHLPFRRLLVSHREGNEASRRANQYFGFKFTGKEEIDWPDGTNAPAYVYELDLAAL